MKTTQQSYRERLDRVTAFLHANLETDIGIDALSDVASLSSYHGHRIYTAMRSDETVATTLRRLRLQRSAGRLANTDMKDAYHWLYGVWLPASGYEISERPGFETYLNSPVDTKPEDLRSDIYLPVEAV